MDVLRFDSPLILQHLVHLALIIGSKLAQLREELLQYFMVDLTQLSVLRFKPIYQERVWGGRTLESLYKRRLPLAGLPYGESWEICDREEAQTVVYGGPLDQWTLHDLWTKARVEVFGADYANHPAERFPLLIKILDAQDDLSIQVHPDDRSAASVNGEAKSEAWFIAQASMGAQLYAGFCEGVTEETFKQSLVDGTVAEQVQTLNVVDGDCLAIPGGTVHAIGAGLVIFEVQQNSDTTYRVFDWNRVGIDGVPRQLHQEEALKVLDFKAPPTLLQRPQGENLLDWSYFKLDRWVGTKFEQRQAPHPGRFVIGAVVEGEITCDGVTLAAGDFFLLPANLKKEQQEIHIASANATVLWIML